MQHSARAEHAIEDKMLIFVATSISPYTMIWERRRKQAESRRHFSHIEYIDD